MALLYASSRRSVLFSGSTKTALVDNLRTELITASAGWTAVSGSSGDYIVQNGVSEVRARLWDTATNCARIGIRKTDDTAQLESNPIFLLPHAGNWQVIATPRQFFVFDPASFTVARKFGCVISPARDTFLSGITNCAIGLCNAQSDTDATLRASFRTHLGPHGGAPNRMTIINGDSWQTASGTANNDADQCLWIFRASHTQNPPISRTWWDGSYIIYEALLQASPTSGTLGSLVGQVEDAMICSYSFQLGDTFVYDGYNWVALTVQAPAGVHSLCLVTSAVSPP